MKAYHQPHFVKKKKRSNAQTDKEHTMQLALVSSFLAAFVTAAMLGKKIAQDEQFRAKYVPAWYDFTVDKPKGWTRDELHEQMVQVQRELHERAIRGEFTREKLEEMRRHAYGANPEEDEHGWSQLHPGVDDDEAIYEDEEE